jgi:hypothetical protein
MKAKGREVGICGEEQATLVAARKIGIIIKTREI